MESKIKSFLTDRSSGKTVKCIISLILFPIVLVAAFYYVTSVFVPKWGTGELWEPVTNMCEGFYDEPENSMDVVYLGSSNAFYDINPLIAYEETGLTGYTLGSSEQRVWVTYYYLQEILKYQNPKVVVFEVNMVYDSDYNDEDKTRKAYDYMRFSQEKLDSIDESVMGDDIPWTYIFPFFRYHTRYDDLTNNDYSHAFSKKHYYLKGYAYSDEVFKGLSTFDMESIDHGEMELDKKVETYLDKMVALCEENNIQLIFIKTPRIDWGVREYNTIQSYCYKKGIDYVDYNTLVHRIGMDEDTCFRDGAHLNYTGAEILSKNLGNRVLKALNNEVPEHADAVTAEWDADLQTYYENRGK